MNYLDILVLFGVIFFIVAYGIWKTRGQVNTKDYLLGGNTMKWGTIGLSIMATQASAITFISTPGQGYESGLGFIQNYFGLPFALIVISIVFIPIFYKFKVFTAYEYLERRFDLQTRLLGAFLFLIQRGMAAGITIYAPAIIITSILDWDLSITIVSTGLLVIIYTVVGGTRAVSVTHKQQMMVIMVGMFVIFFILLGYIQEHTSIPGALKLAGSLGKLDAVDLNFDITSRYTIWSGITGGFFLALSYFGTDQSQVQRYLGGANVTESRIGLMFNALLKIPMQFFILLTGVMVYVFYIFYQPPVHFKTNSLQMVQESSYQNELADLSKVYDSLIVTRKIAASQIIKEPSKAAQEKYITQLKEADAQSVSIRNKVKRLIEKTSPQTSTKDSDYVFLGFILKYLPHGLIGLLIAVIFSAAMSSTSSELNALSSTSSIDFYKRIVLKSGSEKHYLLVSRLLTLAWGIIAISFALLAKSSENLIEAINIIGSIFYGTILGIFLVAFFIKQVKGSSVFQAAIISQIGVITCHFMNQYGIFNLSYLWYNVIGAIATIILSVFLQKLKEWYA